MADDAPSGEDAANRLQQDGEHAAENAPESDEAQLRPAGGADTSTAQVKKPAEDGDDGQIVQDHVASSGEHPANADDYNVDVNERVEKRVVHGEEQDSSGDEYETMTTITRTTKTTTYSEKPRQPAPRPRMPPPPPPQPETFFHSEDMSANKKLYGKDLSVYENMDLDDLLDQLTPEEVDLLTRDVDPDDTLMPPCQRLSYRCDKQPTGPLNRKKLIEHIHQQALNEPDRPEMVPYEPNTIRGKKWIPPPPPLQEQKLEEEIALDMGDEYETALGDASEGELVDLAAILGFHSMMNQEQYHASLLGKRLETDVGWAGITRASRPKPMTPEPPNDTDAEESITRLQADDPQLQQLNLNNIKTMSDEQIERLCAAAAANTQLESLLMSNTGLSDRHAEHLIALLERNRTLREISLESNFISPAMVARLVKAMLKNKTVEAFRAANQRSAVLGNKVEMEITKYVEQNPTILQLGVHFQFNDSRARVAAQLQKNRDRLRLKRIGRACRNATAGFVLRRVAP